MLSSFHVNGIISQKYTNFIVLVSRIGNNTIFPSPTFLHLYVCMYIGDGNRYRYCILTGMEKEMRMEITCQEWKVMHSCLPILLNILNQHPQCPRFATITQYQIDRTQSLAVTSVTLVNFD